MYNPNRDIIWVYEKYQCTTHMDLTLIWISTDLEIPGCMSWSVKAGYCNLKLSRRLRLVGLMVFSATINNISVISWWSVLLVEETGVPGKKQPTSASHWQTRRLRVQYFNFYKTLSFGLEFLMFVSQYERQMYLNIALIINDI